MREPTMIGDYEVRRTERTGAVVRYAATHVVLPRRAVIELLAADAPRSDALKLMRRACILEALQHPAVPRVFECGRLDGRPWIAITPEDGTTLHDELQNRRLEVREALTLLEELAAFLSHAHSRGVLHGNITPTAIVRAPTLEIQRWENARVYEQWSDRIHGADDVLALGNTVSAALSRPDAAPEALTDLLSRMVAADPAARPTAAEVVSEARAIRTAIGSIDQFDVDHVLEGLADEDESPEISIEYAAGESDEPTDDDHDDEHDGELILLERRRHVELETVIVDLDACG